MVTMRRLQDGNLFCDASAARHSASGDYNLRMRMDGANPAIMVQHGGASFADAKVATFKLDGKLLFVQPITIEVPNGDGHFVAIDVPEPRFSNELLAKIYDPSARILSVNIDTSTFSAPIFGYQAVIAAFTECDRKLRTLTVHNRPQGRAVGVTRGLGSTTSTGDVQ
jgi:hypothetical protein